MASRSRRRPLRERDTLVLPGGTVRWIGYHFVGTLSCTSGGFCCSKAIRCRRGAAWRRGYRRAERAVAAVEWLSLHWSFSWRRARPIQRRRRLATRHLLSHVHERYLLDVAPLYLCFFLFWIYRRRQFPIGSTVPLVVVSVLLPLTLPFSDVLNTATWGSKPALVPWSNTLIAERHVPVAMMVMICLFSLLLFYPALLVRDPPGRPRGLGASLTGLIAQTGSMRRPSTFRAATSVRRHG